jgi:hypothetical protein
MTGGLTFLFFDENLMTTNNNDDKKNDFYDDVVDEKKIVHYINPENKKNFRKLNEKNMLVFFC